VALARTHKGFEVIDRNHLKAILTEHKLASDGLIDPITAKKLGQIVGADVLLTGTMTPFSENVRVTVKALATDTARIITADSADLPKTQTITELLSKGIGSSRENGSSRHGIPPSSTGSSLSSPPQPENRVVVVQEVQYELLACRGMANTVKCSFRVTNRGADQTVDHTCDQPTRAFDNFGNESPASGCSIANKVGTWRVEAELISGVPLGASVIFSKLNPTATTLALVNIGTSVGRRSFEDVTFRNVPIVR
jgi:hypothetical protein